MNVETTTPKIHFIRNQKVMLDYDLAALYEIETKVLKQGVRRNMLRFPKDFMFELTNEEFKSLRSQIVTSKQGGHRHLPFAFTEQGIAMLSSILNSEKAIKINIAIMRTFVLLRNSVLSMEEINNKIKAIENQLPDIYKILNFLMERNENDTNIRQKIGYKQ